MGTRQRFRCGVQAARRRHADELRATFARLGGHDAPSAGVQVVRQQQAGVRAAAVLPQPSRQALFG